MDEIHIVIKRPGPRTIERTVFILIILVLVVLLVMKTVSTPAGTAAANATTTTAAAAATTTKAGATTTAAPATTTSTTTTTVKTTTTTAAPSVEAGLDAKIVGLIYYNYNTSTYNSSYISSHKKITGIKLQLTNNYIADLDVRAIVYFNDSYFTSVGEEEANRNAQETLTIPTIKVGETITYTGDVSIPYMHLDYQKILRVDFIPRLGAGEETVYKTVTYTIKAT